MDTLERDLRTKPATQPVIPRPRPAGDDMATSELNLRITRVVLDLSEVSFIGAAGISALNQAVLRAQRTGTTLEIVSGGKYSPDKFANRGRES